MAIIDGSNEPLKYKVDTEEVQTAHVMDRRKLLQVMGAAIGAATLAGCGAGSGETGAALATGTRGQATLKITWPSRTATRLIPIDSNSIVASFSSGSTVVATQTVARPTTGTTSTVSFSSLPTGALTLQATAYPTTDGTGVAQATASTSVTIVASTSIATSITMDSTVDHLTITPASPTVAVGSTTALTMTAYDAATDVVLTSTSTVSWVSANTSVATVSSAGVVTGVTPGSAQITVTESESGKSASTSLTVTSTSHAVTPEGEVGPYFTDDSASGYNRSNILSNLDGTDTQTGIPLTLQVYVYDTEKNGAPFQGAQVDIWHCNAYGVYSNESSESTLGQSWLRGYQLTDTNGLVTFTTIVPGWYQGRTTHIHLRVRSSYDENDGLNDGTNTTQLFFPQAMLNTISSTVTPYSTNGVDPTTNASDHVYTPETQGQTLMTLTGTIGAGYSSTFGIYLPITSE